MGYARARTTSLKYSSTPPPPAQVGQTLHQQEHHAPPAQQGQQMIHLNWAYFIPELSVKPDKDAEAHLLCINDWMNAHHFMECVKVQRFCLALLGRLGCCINH